MDAQDPVGSLVYGGQTTGAAIDSVGETDSFTIDLDEGQSVTVAVDPTAGLRPTLELFDPASASLGTAVAVASGKEATLQTIDTTTAGTYTITVGGHVSTTGPYTVQLVLNAAVEDETHDGSTNNESADAQDLDGTFIDVGGGSAERGAVLGRLLAAAGGVEILIDSEDFESDSLGDQWATYVSNNRGRIDVTNQRGAAGGSSFALLMDSSRNRTYVLNEAIWTVNLAGLTNATLEFSHAEWSDEETSGTDETDFLGDFTGHFNADGVAISQDGETWHPVWDAPNQSTNGQWQHYSIDLAAQAAAASMSLGPDFKIKFQQYDNYGLTSDGRGYDEISITTSAVTEDWYHFTLDDGQSTTLALAALTGGGLTLDLYDDGANLLATGVAGNNVDRVIHNVVDATNDGAPDTYYIRVNGDVDSEYNLLVTRDADFDVEPNGGLGPDAQDVEPALVVMGAITGSGGVDSFSFPVTVGDTLIFSTTTPADGPGQFVNAFDPTIELYDPGGGLVASDNNSGPDGRNAYLVHSALATGDYTVFVEGDGSSTGEYVVSVGGFATSLPALKPILPWGSLIYDRSVNSTVPVAGHVDRWTVHLEDGQTIALVIDPATGLQPSIDLSDPFGASLAAATAGAPGESTFLQATATNGAGIYTVAVTGENGTSGAYAMQFILNAAAEEEPHGAGGNDNPGSAEDLGPSFTSLGGSIRRGAVLGDLTGSEDWYQFTLGDGQSASVALSELTPGNLTLELYDSSQVLLAGGIASTNVDQLIDGFVDSTTNGGPDTYFARVTGTGTDYSLLVTVDAVYDSEPNDAAPPVTQDTITGAAALGYLQAGESDWYGFSVQAGDSLTITTATPGDDAGQFVNSLDPRIELLHPSGNLIATDDNGAPDGRNAELTHTANVTDMYAVRVVDVGGTGGEYLLRVEGRNGPSPVFEVQNTVPGNGAVILPTSPFTVDFNHPVRLDSLDAADLTVDGEPAVAVTVIDGDTARFELPAVVTKGAHTVTLAGGAVVDLQGTPVTPFSMPVIIDQEWPLVITEVMAVNNSVLTDDDNEYSDWIEIHNPTTEAIDLAGWFLTDADGNLTKWQFPSVTLPAGEYLVVFASNEDRRDPANPLHTNFKLGGGGDYLALVAPDGVTVISSYEPAYPQQYADISYGWSPDFSRQGYFLQPTPGAPNAGLPVDDPTRLVVISEIMYHPASNNDLEEYIELFNRGIASVNLNGWRLDRGVTFTLPDVTLQPGAFLAVAADTAVFAGLYPAVTNVVGGWTGRLSDRGETIELVGVGGDRMDRVEYADSGEWSFRVVVEDTRFLNSGLGGYMQGHDWSGLHDGGGRSLELINPLMPGNAGQNWAASLADGGTPGVANSVAATDIAPLIRDVEHFPVVPTSADTVTVTAEIQDELGVGLTVVLNYRNDQPGGGAVFETTPMYDDGLHGDGNPADGVYGGQIPARPNNTIVEFYVEASDAGGLSRSWPLPVLGIEEPTESRGANAIYQVDDDFAEGWTPGTPPVYRIIMTVDDWDYFLAWKAINTQTFKPNGQMNSTFIAIDGTGTEVRYNVGVRNRGSGSRTRNPSNFRVNFANDRRWQGVSSLNLNSDTPYDQVVGAALFQMGSIETARATGVKLHLNGTDLAQTGSGMWGHYAAVEVVGNDFLDSHFPENSGGNVYELHDDVAFGQHDLDYVGTNPDTYRTHYFKLTNDEEDDWSDLVHFLDVLENAPDANYLDDVAQVMDIDQWLRHIAVDALLGNTEGGLMSGRGDDFIIYSGTTDTRFVIVPYDLDTLMSSTTRHILSGYRGVRGLSRLLNHPDIVRQHYALMLELTDNFYNPENIHPLIDQVLGPWTGASTINAMKQFVTDRVNNLQGQIPQKFTINDPGLSVVSGYPQTNQSTITISGTAHAAYTHLVLVNGLDAGFSPLNANWSRQIPLNPGINRVLVQTFDNPNGTGEPLESEYLEIWYQPGGGGTAIPGGNITANTTWAAADGPFTVGGNVIVDPGVTLTIEAGTSVFFGAGTSLTVNGQLLAEGAAHDEIRFTRVPGSGNWDGVQLAGTLEDNRIAHAILEYADTDQGQIGVQDSNLSVDRTTFEHTEHRHIRSQGSSLIVSNSVFADSSFAGAVPTDEAEHIWGSGVPTGGHFIVENNVFGVTPGNNDAIDFDAGHRAAGDPVPQIAGNTFLGGGDDALDLDGDFHVEGNVFMHYRKDEDHQGAGAVGESNVISAGDGDGVGHEYVVVRNVFYDSDHAALIKNGSFMTFVNNTIVDISPGTYADFAGGLYFDNPNDPASQHGDGAYVDGNIFVGTPDTFNFLDAEGSTTDLTVHRSILPAAWHGYGTGNLDDDPRLVENGDRSNLPGWPGGCCAQIGPVPFFLGPGSAAVGSGPNGQDMGALIAAGASVSGEPSAVTAETTATLVIGPPGPPAPHYAVYTDYKYRVNAGAWSGETPIASPIQLSGLTNGIYTVEVIGKNSAGLWQGEADATASQTWTVNTSLDRLRINEVLAINTTVVDHETTFPDLIELVNEGAAPVDLSGMSLSDDPLNPTRFVFPADTTLAAGEFLVLLADNSAATSGLHLGFALDGSGDGVFLFDTIANGGGLLDSVEFGPQIADLSIGRVGQEGSWTLTQPTFGAANAAQPTGDPSTLKINEWFTDDIVRLTDDFVELYNPDPLPVALGGLSFTDNPTYPPATHVIAPLSFVADNGFVAFIADGAPEDGGGHLDFRLSAQQEMLGLYDADGNQIDKLIFYGQTVDYSHGRLPDGTGDHDYTFFPLPTPGRSNGATAEELALLNGLRVSEVMYHPSGDPDLEFIELRNVGAVPLDLDGIRFSQGVDFTFPPLTLGPDQYVVVARDLDEFTAYFGRGINVAGQYGDNLADNGEELALLFPAPLDVAIQRFDYNDAWYPSTDGGGYSLVIRDDTAPVATWNLEESWQAGLVQDGSPGRADGDPPPISEIVVINEVLSHTDLPDTDSIELHNPGSEPVNIGGWYLSDSSDNYRKFAIPGGTTIEGGGYVVFDESHFNTSGGTDPNDFALDGAHGDQIWLTEADASHNLIRFADRLEFQAVANGESFGRWPNATGELYPMITTTLGDANSGPRVGPVIISEIMYHPTPPTPADLAIYPGLTENDLEFIEIYNSTGDAVELTEWRIRKGIDFDFAAGSTLGPGEMIVVLSFDPEAEDAQGQKINVERTAAFRNHYGIGDSLTLIGGYSEQLDNGGERVQLQRPDEPPLEEPNFIPRLLEDEALYDDVSPWPTEPDGGGQSLQRVPAEWGHAATSWEAAAPTPGTPPIHTLDVLDFSPTPSGFVVTFNRPFDASELNLYDDQAGTIGPPDVTLVGDTVGPVMGSLVVNANSLTFVATGGPLSADTYTATLRGAADALLDQLGQPLDGDGDGTPGGDFVDQFSRLPHDVIVSLPDFTRGSGQAVDVPATTLGWPLTLSDNRPGDGDIKSVVLTITYDPAALSITAAERGPDVPVGASLIVDTNTAGLVTLSLSSTSTPLASGDSYIVKLTAAVPAGADYGGVHVVDLSGLVVTGVGDAPVDATADDAVHVAAYFGDSTGNGAYSGLDAQRVARVGVGLDSGFEAYPAVDPVIVADITGNGALSGLDAQMIAREAVGMAPPEIPPIGQPLRLSQPQQPGFSTPLPIDANSPIRSTPEAGLLTSTAQDSSRSRETSGDQVADAQTSGVGDTPRVSPNPDVFLIERPSTLFGQAPVPCIQTTQPLAFALRDPVITDHTLPLVISRPSTDEYRFIEDDPDADPWRDTDVWKNEIVDELFSGQLRWGV